MTLFDPQNKKIPEGYFNKYSLDCQFTFRKFSQSNNGIGKKKFSLWNIPFRIVKKLTTILNSIKFTETRNILEV